jgi:hypothetical protein
MNRQVFKKGLIHVKNFKKLPGVSTIAKSLTAVLERIFS